MLLVRGQAVLLLCFGASEAPVQQTRVDPTIGAVGSRHLKKPLLSLRNAYLLLVAFSDPLSSESYIANTGPDQNDQDRARGGLENLHLDSGRGIRTEPVTSGQTREDMTGEMVLQQIWKREERPFAERLAAALVKKGERDLVEARDAFEDEGGQVLSWKDEATGHRVCELLLNGERVAFATSDQTSGDAEAHAFQNLNNNRFNAEGA